MGKWGDIAELAGFVPEPYQTDRVMAWALLQEYPFTMREAVNTIGLPAPIVHRILGRQTKKGTLTRIQYRASYHCRGLGRQTTRLTYLYSVAGRDDA